MCRPNPNNVTGGRTRKTPEEEGEPDGAVAIPDLTWYYDAEGGYEESVYRKGGRQIAPPVQIANSTSRQESWSGSATVRSESREVIPWRIHSDTAKRLNGDRITGDRPLPESHRMYRAMMRQAVQIYQVMKRVGLAPRNWLRLEGVSENWGEAVDKASPSRGSAAEECRPVEHQEPTAEDSLPVDNWNTRCGAEDVMKEGAFETGRRMPLTQEMYGAEMTYAKTAHEVEVLMNSLSAGTRKGYSRCWEHCVSFCRGVNQSVWLDSR